MISVGPFGCLAWQNFNVAIFWKNVNVMNVGLCMMVVLIELYLFVTFVSAAPHHGYDRHQPPLH